MNLTKEVKYLYYENLKMLIKEIEDDTKKWKGSLWSHVKRVNIAKMAGFFLFVCFFFLRTALQHMELPRLGV